MDAITALKMKNKKPKSRHGAQLPAAPAKEEKPALKKLNIAKKRGRPPINGERMTKAEYQRRYRAKKKAEKDMKE